MQVWLVTRLKIDRLKLVVPVINIEATDFVWQGICLVLIGERILLDPEIVTLGAILERGEGLSRAKLSKLSLSSDLVRMRCVGPTILILGLILHIELEGTIL